MHRVSLIRGIMHVTACSVELTWNVNIFLREYCYSYNSRSSVCWANLIISEVLKIFHYLRIFRYYFWYIWFSYPKTCSESQVLATSTVAFYSVIKSDSSVHWKVHFVLPLSVGKSPVYTAPLKVFVHILIAKLMLSVIFSV